MRINVVKRRQHKFFPSLKGQTARLSLHLAWTVKGVAANDECAGVVLCCHRGFTVMTFDNKHHQEISRNNCKLRERGKEGGRQSVAVASGGEIK